jgi:Transposase zinc-binding domain
MTRPAIEVADIVRAKGRQYLEHHQSSVTYQQLKAYRAVERCRTAALGGHKDKCVNCLFEAPHSYNSCRSRCCPSARRRSVGDGLKHSRAIC